MPNDEHRADPAAMAAADRLAEQQNDAAAEADAAADRVADAMPVRARRVITTKDFLPRNNPDWIMQHVVAKGRGTHVKVARLYGACHATERQENDFQGKQLSSVRMIGLFEAANLETGEIVNGTAVFLPLAFAEQVEAAFRMGGERVDIDVDIGIEATGKTIPYEWTITSYIGGEARRALRNLRNRRPTMLSEDAQRRLGHDTTAQGNA